MPSNAIRSRRRRSLPTLPLSSRRPLPGVIVNYRVSLLRRTLLCGRLLREAGVKYMVVKNTMTGRACEECGYGASRRTPNGMTAIAISESDLIAPADSRSTTRRSSPSAFLPDTWTVRCWTPTVSGNWRQFLQRKC